MRIEGGRSAGATRGVGTISRGAPRTGGSESSRAFSPAISTPAARGPRLSSYIAPRSESSPSLPTFARVQRSFSASMETPRSAFETRTGRSLGLSSINIPRAAKASDIHWSNDIGRHGIRERSPRKSYVSHESGPKSYDRAHLRVRHEEVGKSQPPSPFGLSEPIGKQLKIIPTKISASIPEIRHERFRPASRGPILTEPKRSFLPSRHVESDDAREILRELNKKREKAQEASAPLIGDVANRTDIDEAKPAIAVNAKKQPLFAKVIAIRKAEQSRDTATQTELSTQEQPMFVTARKKLTEVVTKLKVGLSTVTEASPQAKPATRAKTKMEQNTKPETAIFAPKKIETEELEESADDAAPELDINATKAREKLILFLRMTVIEKFKSKGKEPTWNDVASRMPIRPDKKTISEIVANKETDGSYTEVRNKLAKARKIYNINIVQRLIYTIKAVRLRPKPQVHVTDEDVRRVFDNIPNSVKQRGGSQAA